MEPGHAIFTHIKIKSANVCNSVSSQVLLYRQKSVQYSKPYPLSVILFLAVVVPSSVIAQTAIAARRTGTEVIVAADSKGGEDTGTNIIDRPRECKIRPAGKYFFAAAGMIKSRDDTVDAYKLAEELGTSQLPLSEIVSEFYVRMKEPLARRFQEIKKEDPDRFAQAINTQKLQVVFFGIYSKSPTMVVLAFKIAVNSEGIVRTEPFGADCGQNECTYFLGRSEAAYALEGTAGFWKKGVIPEIRSLIQAEIDSANEKAAKHKTKPEVGPPIGILRVTKNGACWVQKKAECDKEQRIKPCRPRKPG